MTRTMEVDGKDNGYTPTICMFYYFIFFFIFTDLYCLEVIYMMTVKKDQTMNMKDNNNSYTMDVTLQC